MNSGTDKAKTEELSDIDILEDSILHLDKSLMQELLFDRATRKNIVWATSDYEFLGEEYLASAEITLQAITGANNRIIQPRVAVRFIELDDGTKAPKAFSDISVKISQDAMSRVYRFVPIQDFTKSWTDAELYAKYHLTDDEIAFIEAMIKPME